MRFTAAIVILTVGSVKALSPNTNAKITGLVGTIPQCGLTCLIDAITVHSTCSPIGYQCQCSQPNHRRIKVATVPCILQSNCTQQQQLQIHAITDEICDLVYGIPVPADTKALAEGSGASSLSPAHLGKVAGLIAAVAAAPAWIL